MRAAESKAAAWYVCKDEHTGGWQRWALIFGRWECLGYYGTRAAAVGARSRP